MATSADPFIIQCTARATCRQRLAYKIGGFLVNTTGFKGLFQIKAFESAPLPLLSGTHLDYISFSGIDGGILLNIPASVTKNFLFEKAYYHWFVENPSSGVVKRILHGPFLVNLT